MNNKILKPIIATAAVLAVLVAGYFLLRLIPDKEPEVTSTPTPPATAQTIYLIQEDYYTLDSFEFAFDDGERIRITVGMQDGQRVFELSPAQVSWTYDQELLRAAAFNIVSVSALAEVAKDAKNLSEYELLKPHMTVKANFTVDGKKVEYELSIGKKTELGDSYYCMLNGDKSVYAVNRYTVEKLMTRELGYRELDFYPSYLDESTGEVNAGDYISYVRVLDPEKNTDIEIFKRSDEELAELPVGSTYFYMAKPVVSECNDTNVKDKLINILARIKVEGIVADNPQDLSEYGLDNPVEIWLTNDEGQSIHYYIGTSNGTNAYIMVEGCDSVLFTSSYYSEYRNFTYVEYMFKLVWIHSINDVKSITFDMAGDKHILTITDNYKDDEGNTVFNASLDGRPVSESNTKRLFSRMLNMMILGSLDEIIQVENLTPEYTFTVNMKDGTQSKLELYMLNERRYAASLNGEDALFYINASDIKTLGKAFETIAAGEELDR
jgi:hypothetical protein